MSRLDELIAKGLLTAGESELIAAAPRVVERLEKLDTVDRRATRRLVQVARAWDRERSATALGRPRPHYARYSPAIINAIEPRIGKSKEILDPMAGTLERLAVLEQPERGWHQVWGVELEPEWVDGYPHPRLLQGDARALPFPAERFDVICVSPSYGNRDADRTGEWWDNPDRRTYAAALGRNPSDGSLCVPFRSSGYRSGHALAWADAVRVLRPGGLFVIVLKNFVGDGVVNRMSQWHREVLRDGLALREVDDTSVHAVGRRFGANAGLRAESVDKIYVYTRPPGADVHAARLVEQLAKEYSTDG